MPCKSNTVVAQQFKKGDRVFGLAPWFWMSFKEGTYAEYVNAKEDWLAYCPESLPLHEAGQVPLVALTAWQVRQYNLLHCHMHVKAADVQLQCHQLHQKCFIRAAFDREP